MLYPTELLGHISKIFNFSAQTDSNELPLRSSPQFANRFVTKHKETQAFAGFWRVLFLTIPKGF
ncbi:MAG TPA: hypothetical protein H9671_06040, partial [Firmicutes bacterium]|nr:hypothetical protein [Bacillota bacterium]